APGAAAPPDDAAPRPAAKIHVPDPSLGEEPAEAAEAGAASENGDAPGDDSAAPKPRKKTRRGSRGGRNRRKKPTTASANGGEQGEAKAEGTQREPEPVSDDYVPMSEWIDGVESREARRGRSQRA